MGYDLIITSMIEALAKQYKHFYAAITLATVICVNCVSCVHSPKNTFKPLQTFQDTLANGKPGPVMVVLPTGDFSMGASPKEGNEFPFSLPNHKVHIKRAFAIGKYELSFKEYDQFVEATNYNKPSDLGWGTVFWGRNKTPVFNVSWNDVQNYLNWLSEQTDKHYRLPTEAEWEYAARAGTSTVYHFGDCINADQANFHNKEKYLDCPISNVYRGKVMEIGQFPANAWGLHDIHGNVWEWTQDCWHPNYINAPTDGSAWLNHGENVNCNLRVIRGGSWSGRAIDIRASARSRNTKDHKSIFIGLRVVRDLD